MNVLLAGLRGCGKSTVGRLLAERLGRPFIDLDDLVLDRFDEPSVGAVWSTHGEGAWRRAEALVLAETLAPDGRIVALGGGTPMVDEARRLIETGRAEGRLKVVYLRCADDELARRLAAECGDRPSLTGAHPALEIEPVREAREPTLRRLADLECDVTAVPAARVAETIETWLLKPA